MAATGLAATKALAQVADPLDSLLMRPTLDGDPRNPPRFSRAGNGVTTTATVDDPTSLASSPGSGAGDSGFLSTNSKAKGLKGKPGSGAKSSAGPYTTAPAPELMLPPRTVLTGAAKLPQNQARPGAPPRAIVAPIATDPDLAPELAATPPTRKAISAATIQPLAPPTPTLTPLPDDHPFAPTGIDVGSFRLRPAIEVTGGYDSNPNRSPTGGGSATYVVAPELLVNSNWSRHELTASLHGSYSGFEQFPSINRPNVDAKVNGRVDVTNQTQLNLEGRYLLFTDYPGSPNIQAGLAKLPLANTLGATAGVDQHFNRFEVNLRGLFDRTVYQNSTFVDGETESNADRNFNHYEADLRTSYELTPGIKPFAEVDIDYHDLAVDQSGMERDSVGFAGKVGSTVELSRVLVGEASIGYLTRNYKDPTLPNVSGMLLDSSLTWLATALTTVKFTAHTTASETTLTGVSGVFTRELGVEVDHEFRRWLIGSARFTHALDVYVGSPRVDVRYLASAALTYMLTREWQMRAEVRREWRTSNTPGNDYTANIALIGVRMQR